MPLSELEDFTRVIKIKVNSVALDNNFFEAELLIEHQSAPVLLKIPDAIFGETSRLTTCHPQPSNSKLTYKSY